MQKVKRKNVIKNLLKFPLKFEENLQIFVHESPIKNVTKVRGGKKKFHHFY